MKFYSEGEQWLDGTQAVSSRSAVAPAGIYFEIILLICGDTENNNKFLNC